MEYHELYLLSQYSAVADKDFFIREFNTYEDAMDFILDEFMQDGDLIREKQRNNYIWNIYIDWKINGNDGSVTYKEAQFTIMKVYVKC